MLNEFKIPFIGLKEGEHQFDFKIDIRFFEAFGYDEFEEINFNVTLFLNKKTTMLVLDFVAQGYVKTPCDVTGEMFKLNVKGSFPLIVKFGEIYDDENDELLILPHDAYQVEVQQYIYELILLSIPHKRVKEVSSKHSNQDSKKPSPKKQAKEQKIDPRWNQLKQLLDKK